MKQLKQIICCYSGCEIRLPDLIKACHHCNAAYCSSRCRQLDWEAHKHVCFIGLLNSDCKRILAKVNRNTALRNELSKLARTAYLGTLQRGFVWLDYLSNESAQDFLVKHDVSDDLSNFLMFFGNNLLPKYVCFNPNQLVYKKPANSVVRNIFNNQHVSDSALQETSIELFCQNMIDYDPLDEFVLLVSVRIESNEFVLKFMKIKFVNESRRKKEKTSESSDTLILTALKMENSLRADHEESSDEERRIFLANLLVEFESRGIELRSQYPKIYRDLCLYVEDNKHFTPVCLFPRDLNENNLFMCLIMPNSEQCNYSWLYDYENESINSKKNLYNYLYIL